MPFADLNLSKRIRRCQEFSAPFRITDGKKFNLKDIDPGDIGDLESEDKPVVFAPAAIIAALGSLDLKFPEVDERKKAELAAARAALEQE